MKRKVPGLAIPFINSTIIIPLIGTVDSSLME